MKSLAGPHDLTFGLMTSPLTDPRRLERLPLDSLWVGGHVASRNPSPEPLMQLARLAARTDRVRIGTSILSLPLYPPALVAKQTADIDQASGGRLILGVGVGGEYPQEFRACGVPINERGRRADEAIPLLRRLWSGNELTHDGPMYPMTDVRIIPTPLQIGGPPIVVGGRKDPAMRRAAQLGDGWMPYLYSPQRYASSVARIRSLAELLSRDLEEFGWYAFLFVNIDDDGRAAREEAARSLGSMYNQDLHQMIDHVAAVGTVDEVRSRVQAFVDAGARHFIFTPIVGAGSAAPVIERLCGDVLPNVTRPSTYPGAEL